MSEEKEFASQTVNVFTKLGEAVAGFNKDGEWMSATVNITGDPKGEAPVVTAIVYPGTTPKHAKTIQAGLGGFFAGLNK